MINSIADLREIARRRVPRSIFEYVDRGSYDELTLARNRSDLEALKLPPARAHRRVRARAWRQPILGVPATMPLVIGPTGMMGLVHGNGEIHAARAARSTSAFRSASSTVSICSIEDVREVTRDAVLVPALRDEGPRLHHGADRPCRGGRLPGADDDGGYSGLRTSPPRREERARGAAATHAAQCARHRHASRAGRGASARQAPHISATWPPCRAPPARRRFAQWMATQFDASVTWKDLEEVRAAGRAS